MRCFHFNEKKNRMRPYTQTRRTKQGLSKWTELVVEHSRGQANDFQGYLCHEDILISLKPACVPIASIIKHNYWQACSVAGFEGKPNSREDMKLRFDCLHSSLLWDWSWNKKKKNLQYFLLTSLIFNNICRFVLQFCEVSPSSPKEHSYFKCNASILRHKKFLSPHSISINGALRICFSSQVCPALLN